MGQQRAASGTWRSHTKPTYRDSYETMGQQTCPSNMSHPAIDPDRVKKSKSRFEAERKIPSESEGKSSDFARYGMVVIRVHWCSFVVLKRTSRAFLSGNSTKHFTDGHGSGSIQDKAEL